MAKIKMTFYGWDHFLVRVNRLEQEFSNGGRLAQILDETCNRVLIPAMIDYINTDKSTGGSLPLKWRGNLSASLTATTTRDSSGTVIGNIEAADYAEQIIEGRQPGPVGQEEFDRLVMWAREKMQAKNPWAYARSLAKVLETGHTSTLPHDFAGAARKSQHNQVVALVRTRLEEIVAKILN